MRLKDSRLVREQLQEYPFSAVFLNPTADGKYRTDDFEPEYPVSKVISQLDSTTFHNSLKRDLEAAPAPWIWLIHQRETEGRRVIYAGPFTKDAVNQFHDYAVNQEV